MKRWHKIALAAVLLALAGGLGWWRMRGSNQEELRTATVQRGTLVREVTFTGEVQARHTADLALEYGGIVREVLVQAGDTVQPGTKLVQLDTTSPQLEAAKAAADLASAQEAARLGSEKLAQDAQNVKAENTRSVEEQRQQVRSAKADMEEAQRVWLARVDESGEESALARTAFATYVTAKNSYVAAQKALDTLLKTVKKTNEAADAAARVAQEEYVATTQASGATAGLSSLEALRRLATTKLAKLSLTAPFAGTVTDVTVTAGEYAAVGTTIATVATVNELHVVADVTETDAAKITTGMSATIAFDALPDLAEWPASVIAIAPAAKTIEGVPTYEVTLQIVTTAPELKPGLTADVTVHIATRENVLVIPRRAVITHNGRDAVRTRRQNGSFEEVPVTTGALGSDGQIEIVEGLDAGQEIVVSLPNAK